MTCRDAATPDLTLRWEEGAVDREGRLFGHPDIRVVDGSIVPADLGVNPSLTITAMAERAMSALAATG